MRKKRKEHPLLQDFNKHISIYNFRILEDESAVPTQPIVIKDVEEIGERFHCEVLIPEDAPPSACIHALSFFETIYANQPFEFTTTVSEAVSSGYLIVCFVTQPKLAH